jgi:hypothetical protein
MGSILPLVEMRLRIDPRSTWVARTFNGVWRLKIGIVARAASTPIVSQVRVLRVAGRPFELWVAANRLSFSVRRGQLQALIYHSGGRGKTYAVPSRCVFRCGLSTADA